MPEYTDSQKAILEILSDGRNHKREELLISLPTKSDGLAGLAAHLCRIRKKLRPIGQDIVCVLYQRQVHYRHVRLLSNNE